MTARWEAKAAGIAYLSYIAFTMTSSILYGRATAGGTAAETLATLGHMMATARLTVLLDLLQIVCALVLAVTLFQLTQAVSPTLALLAMVFRIGEGLLGALPLLSKLELMQLAVGPTARKLDGLSTGLAIADEVLRRPDFGFSEFCFVVGGFIFACLFLRGRLIPIWLAWIGVATIGVQMICVPLHIAGIVPGSLVERLWMAILLYEVPLGCWLLIKGVARSDAPSGTAWIQDASDRFAP